MKNKNTVKTISYVMIITLLGKAMALVRQSLLANAYGTGMEASAFLAASVLPRVFFDAVFVSAITMSFIPTFSKCMKEGGKAKAFDFSNVFITIVGILMVVIAGLGMIFSYSIATFSVPKFDQAGIQLTSDLLKILFPTMLFTGVTFCFIGILQSLESFLIPALTSVVFNGVIILYFFGPNNRWGIYGLAGVYLIGWILQAVIQIPVLQKKKYKFKLNFNWKNKYLKQVGILLLPVMVSTWVQPFNIFVNTQFSSGIYPDGAATSGINFANDLYTMIVGVFVLSIMNVLFPKMSDLVNAGKREELEKLTGQTLGTALFFVIPMMIGLMSLSDGVIQLIYGRGDFGTFSVNITSTALFYFSLGMVGYALQTILARVYFAERNGRVPMIGAIVAIVINIILCQLLIIPMKIGGLALASSISGTVYGLILMLPLLKKNRQVFNRRFGLDIVKMSISALAMAGVIYLVKPLLHQLAIGSFIAQIIYLGGLIIIGIIIYGVMVFMLRVEKIQEVKDFLRNRKGKINS